MPSCQVLVDGDPYGRAGCNIIFICMVISDSVMGILDKLEGSPLGSNGRYQFHRLRFEPTLIWVIKLMRGVWKEVP